MNSQNAKNFVNSFSKFYGNMKNLGVQRLEILPRDEEMEIELDVEHFLKFFEDEKYYFGDMKLKRVGYTGKRYEYNVNVNGIVILISAVEKNSDVDIRKVPKVEYIEN